MEKNERTQRSIETESARGRVKQSYALWSVDPFFDEATRRELLALTDEREIEDRFYRDLAFGTGGMRGVMGAGTNRMNVYTVCKASAGLAACLLDEDAAFAKARGVAIAYDTRHNSAAFALSAAETFAHAGIPALLFERPVPTPALSFAVRRLGCAAGVVVTASHNPREYNGYKVYNREGGQVTPESAARITCFVERTPVTAARRMEQSAARAAGLLRTLKSDVLDAFCAAVLTQSHPLDAAAKAALKIVYTPLHGTGLEPVTAVLQRAGYIPSLVEEQAKPDGAFPTVDSPNPEEKDALRLGIRLAEQTKADIVLGTDPDGDRVGAAVRQDGGYTLLSGNQIGALLVDYVIARRRAQLTARDAVVKTIVTSELGARIARRAGLHVVETLTGFKYIGEQANEFERTGEHRFLMGYEESFGYLVGTHARDKDAVVSSLLLCEMAAYYMAQGRTLLDVLSVLYAEYGVYLDALDSFTFHGREGAEKIASLTAAFREKGLPLSGEAPLETLDYAKGVAGLPKENVLKFTFAQGSWIAVRPSGTEPKLKVYYSIRGETQAEAEQKLSFARAAVRTAADL